MRATVQIDKYAWQREQALYIFYIDFDIKPQRNDMLEIKYKGRLIKATVYSVEHKLKINSDNCNNEKPKFFIRAERLQEYDIEQKFIKKRFRYLYKDKLKFIEKN